jgi:aromatic amino acid aminotransferase I
LKVDWKKHPQVASMSMDAIEEQVFMATIDAGALVTKGTWFQASPVANQDSIFFRATFSAAPLDKLELAIERFGVAVRRVFELEA